MLDGKSGQYTSQGVTIAPNHIFKDLGSITIDFIEVLPPSGGFNTLQVVVD